MSEIQNRPLGATRQNLGMEAAQRLRAEIIDGTWAAGTRLQEIRLTEHLGVSRTPVREALSILAAEGFVRASPRKGVTVVELSSEEVEELYPLRALLDPAALALSPLPSVQRIGTLREINRLLLATDDPAEGVDLDDRWHRLLLSDCSNRILLGFIDQVIARSRRYEVAFLSETGHVSAATEQHEQIIRALEEKDMVRASEHLVANMSSALAPLLDWLHQRKPQS